MKAAQLTDFIANEFNASLSYSIPNGTFPLIPSGKWNDRVVFPYLTTDDAGNEVVDKIEEGYTLADCSISKSLFKNKVSLTGGV
ncbi:MAG: hypothetical protein R2784_09560 [Saprospiraceae bacterium]